MIIVFQPRPCRGLYGGCFRIVFKKTSKTQTCNQQLQELSHSQLCSSHIAAHKNIVFGSKHWKKRTISSSNNYHTVNYSAFIEWLAVTNYFMYLKGTALMGLIPSISILCCKSNQTSSLTTHIQKLEFINECMFW